MTDAERDRGPADGDVPESAPTDEERQRKWAEDADSSEAVEPPDTEESIREDDGDFPMGGDPPTDPQLPGAGDVPTIFFSR